MSDLVGNHIVGFPTRRLIFFPEKQDGEQCTSSEECLVQDSACNGGRCGCPANMYLQGMACLNSKLVET